MPITFTIHDAKNLIVTTAVGQVGYPDLEHYLAALVSSPDYRPGLDEIFDLSDATLVDVTADQVRQFSQATLPDELPAGQSRCRCCW